MKSEQPILQRAIVTLGGTDDKQIPVQQVFYQGKAADVEVVFPYGMHANMAPGETLCTVSSVNNEEDYRVATGYTPNLRPKPLEIGEVVFYHPITQSRIYFRNNGDIDLISNEAETDGGSLNMTITKDLNIVIGGDASITTSGDTSITTTGNTAIDSGGTTDITSTGAASVVSDAALTLTGSTVAITATSGDVSVDGSGIKLNAATDVDGDLDVNGDSTADDHISGSVSGNSHTHVAPAGGGTTTGPT